MIRLLGRATSGNVQKVIFMLEELGLIEPRVSSRTSGSNHSASAAASVAPAASSSGTDQRARRTPGASVPG